MAYGAAALLPVAAAALLANLATIPNLDWVGFAALLNLSILIRNS